MARTLSPLEPRVEVRFFGDREIDQILRELLELLQCGCLFPDTLSAQIMEDFGVAPDQVRLRAAMDRLGFERRRGFAPGSYMAQIRYDRSAHQRLRITSTLLLDDEARHAR